MPASEVPARDPGSVGPGVSGISPGISIAVVHLVRARNGIEPFRRFLESYQANSAGIDHDLLIVFKGFRGSITASYRTLLKRVAHREWHVGDTGFDITPYFKAAREFEYDYFCFLNSYSILLARNWLSKLYLQSSREGVGLVGATGSWESHYSTLSGIAGAQGVSSSSVRRLAKCAVNPILMKYYKSYFDPFPNYHIRTNAFMVRREILLAIRPPSLFFKIDAHRFESGKKSLTKQILAMNLKVVVAGNDGAGYEKEDWNRANTFRQLDQGNLLVADNQTMQYHRLSTEEKRIYSTQTWGKDLS